ncbi:MAG: dTDP-4-dehydrorhamnose 3,5-epimerase [Actinomycetota bacterium]|nr:dTDP-4-dehydrorhamnose 3,5-epimerase [Actinomycetota bacterium]
MRFLPTELEGCVVVEPEPHHDERGFFARTFSADDFRALGLNPAVAECSVSFNSVRGTLRGMHFQAAPHAEAKLVRCTRGRMFDVAVDLRPESPTYLRWTSVELTADNRRSLFVPEGFAHGFLTLEDATEVSYQVSHPYVAGSGSGLRWDDPRLAIAWPDVGSLTISDRDRAWPLLDVSDRRR